MCAVYYGNIWRAKQFPFMSQALFDETGKYFGAGSTLCVSNQ